MRFFFEYVTLLLMFNEDFIKNWEQGEDMDFFWL